MKRREPPLSAKEAQQQLRAAAKSLGQRRLPSEWPRFIEYGWRRFEPRTVIELLVSDEPSYEGHKAILFAGLCTWVACPSKRDGLRMHGMLLVGIEQLRRAEELGRRAALGGSAMVADMVGRMSAIGPDFYSDFYYPIGGIAQVVRSTTPGNFRRSLERRSGEMLTIVAMMQIFDFHAKHLGDGERFYSASLGKGTKLQDEVHRAAKKSGGVNPDNADKRWKTLYASAALSYAASTIPVDATRNLLDVIRLGEGSYETHSHLLPQWLARARYAADTILTGLPESRFAQANAAILPDVATEPTPEPLFTANEQATITNSFNIRCTLKGRGWSDPVRRVNPKIN
ncbi:MAG: hypothetical protein ABW003_19385 [Microvirga sp.]